MYTLLHRRLKRAAALCRISRMSRRKWAIVLILLLAAMMRLWLLTDVPPGMTHDEADHGLDAWGVVQGIRPIYFPTAYGREPFFDYATAILMSFMGPTFLAGRLTAVFASLILIAATYAWSRIAFNERVALFAAIGLTVNFWAVMTARHALRSVTLPAIFMLAVCFYWKALRRHEVAQLRGISPNHFVILSSSVLAGLLLGLSFYTYIPSRILWVLFPALLVYWVIIDRVSLRRHWLTTMLMLAVAGMIAFSLFNHLATSGDEVRLSALDGPLEAARRGEFDPLIENMVGALKLFTIYGDDGPVSVRYNLPGRPLLTTVVGWLFYVGVALSLLAALMTEERVEESAEYKAYLNALQTWNEQYTTLWDAWVKENGLSFEPSESADDIDDSWMDEAAAFVAKQIEPIPLPPKPRRTGAGNHAFALMWLIAGLSPALVTGPEAATTRAIGMQPVLFVFPAIALDFLASTIGRKQQSDGTYRSRLGELLVTPLAIILFGYVGFDTTRAYFVEWANLPDVRVQYETTRVTAIEWLNEHGSGAVALASPRPDRFHDPSTALMTLRNDDVSLRWFNGKSDDGSSGSLLLPDAAQATLMISGWGALHPVLQPFMEGIEPVEMLPMREDDLDRPIEIYQFDTRQHALDLMQRFTRVGPVLFGEHVELLGYELLLAETTPNSTLQLVTLWRIHKPIDGLKLFTHLSNDPTQPPLANEDSLDVPSYYWQPNDIFIQLHQFPIPDTASGQYTLTVGAYTQPSPDQFIRLKTSVGDSYPITTITIP